MFRMRSEADSILKDRLLPLSMVAANVSPESAVGGNLAMLETGDEIKVDLNACRVDLLVSDEELKRRREAYKPAEIQHQTPWQEIYRAHVGQLATGGCLELATNYHCVSDCIPRHNH